MFIYQVSYLHLSRAQPILAIWLADAPREMLELMDEVVTAVVTRAFPAYAEIQDEVRVRVAELPIVDKLRDLREVCHARRNHFQQTIQYLSSFSSIVIIASGLDCAEI